MTFDSGIASMYKVTNTAENGKKPKKGLVKIGQYYFGFQTLGVNRYYTALQAHQQLEAVIAVPGWEPVPVEAVVILESGLQYTVRMTQHALDENGLQITRLSLERNGESYDVIS
jgi:hypothetical protein